MKTENFRGAIRKIFQFGSLSTLLLLFILLMKRVGGILSRDPKMDQEKLEGIMGRLEAAGYDFSDFRINPQQLTESS